MRDLDPNQYGEADRREVDPPVEVRVATWSRAGTLDWWVKERQQWLGQYVVGTVVRDGSKLLIYVRPKRSHDLSMSEESDMGSHIVLALITS